MTKVLKIFNKIKYKILSIIPLIGLMIGGFLMKYNIILSENSKADWLLIFLTLSTIGFHYIIFNKLWKK